MPTTVAGATSSEADEEVALFTPSAKLVEF